eukprot:gnl/TRDRNA2_/TRDRNA2_142328_c0_seq1.p1 gnl/TRDRNA2_/TRDRNA2_142328_c0~~gnl/TRDRNA2_/TRDRNA2_142328_c0_seq1.p1  ORF type:complete len:746 (-),score=104.82 gnl/TRDRNA2_/TRDRNA2_142328_c0_seq1:66-2303(-)
MPKAAKAKGKPPPPASPSESEYSSSEYSGSEYSSSQYSESEYSESEYSRSGSEYSSYSSRTASSDYSDYSPSPKSKSKGQKGFQPPPRRKSELHREELARKEQERKRNEILKGKMRAEKARKEEQAIIKAQAIVRSWFARRTFKKMLAAEKRKRDRVIVEQKLIAMHEQQAMRAELLERKQMRAVTKIQAAFRGRQARKAVSAKLGEKYQSLARMQDRRAIEQRLARLNGKSTAVIRARAANEGGNMSSAGIPLSDREKLLQTRMNELEQQTGAGDRLATYRYGEQPIAPAGPVPSSRELAMRAQTSREGRARMSVAPADAMSRERSARSMVPMKDGKLFACSGNRTVYFEPAQSGSTPSGYQPHPVSHVAHSYTAFAEASQPEPPVLRQVVGRSSCGSTTAVQQREPKRPRDGSPSALAGPLPDRSSLPSSPASLPARTGAEGHGTSASMKTKKSGDANKAAGSMASSLRLPMSLPAAPATLPAPAVPARRVAAADPQQELMYAKMNDIGATIRAKFIERVQQQWAEQGISTLGLAARGDQPPVAGVVAALQSADLEARHSVATRARSSSAVANGARPSSAVADGDQLYFNGTSGQSRSESQRSLRTLARGVKAGEKLRMAQEQMHRPSVPLTDELTGATRSRNAMALPSGAMAKLAMMTSHNSGAATPKGSGGTTPRSSKGTPRSSRPMPRGSPRGTATSHSNAPRGSVKNPDAGGRQSVTKDRRESRDFSGHRGSMSGQFSH